MSKSFNYAQAPLCVICGKHIGMAANHAACSKKKQQLHREALKNPARVKEMYPQFYIQWRSK